MTTGAFRGSIVPMDPEGAGDLPEADPDKRNHEPDDDRESAYSLLQRGMALSAGRHYAQAAIVLERAERLEPGRGSILEVLGRAYFMSGQWESAAAAFERLLDVDPSAHYGHYGRGQSLKRLGRIREARTHLRLAVALSPTSRLYRDALGRLPGRSGDSGAPPPANGGQAGEPG